MQAEQFVKRAIWVKSSFKTNDYITKPMTAVKENTFKIVELTSNIKLVSRNNKQFLESIEHNL